MLTVYVVTYFHINREICGVFKSEAAAQKYIDKHTEQRCLGQYSVIPYEVHGA
jgi:hypothetical protein